ncbi:hypothetical protein Tco_0666865 [Tanacetum coccineum]
MFSVPLHFPKQFMSSYTHPSIPSDHDVEDAFSSINVFNYTSTSPDYFRYFFPFEKISSPKYIETPVESFILVFPSSSVGSSSPVRSTTSSPDYPFDKILESCKRYRTQKQQGRTTRLEFSRIQPLDI